MFSNLALHQGDLEAIISSPKLSPLMKTFSSVSAADGSDILHLLQEQLSASTQETDKVKLQILASVIYLVNSGKRNLCVQLLNKLGNPTNERCSGWQEDLFVSLWNMLLNYLRDEPVDSLSVDDAADFVVLGDSHTIGLSIKTRKAWSNGHYIPGFRFSLLASPQSNLKIVALRNALSLNYDKQHIFLSLGEIDFRSAAINYNARPDGFELVRTFIKPALKCIKKYAGPHQKIYINAPYPLHPQKSEMQNENLNRSVLVEYEKASVLLREECNRHEITLIDMPEEIMTDPLSYKIDHAHYTADVYKKIIVSLIKQIQS